MKRAVIALGTNMGDRQGNLTSAVESLNLLPGTKVLQYSKVYETEPWGYTDQDMFLNACVLVETTLSPQALLGACLGIEAGLGRVRTFKNGPRVIDLDIILYEGVTLNTEELTIPHPRYKEREFVLKPLGDLDLGDMNY